MGCACSVGQEWGGVGVWVQVGECREVSFWGRYQTVWVCWADVWDGCWGGLCGYMCGLGVGLVGWGVWVGYIG
jgi:hypothetical protein